MEKVCEEDKNAEVKQIAKLLIVKTDDLYEIFGYSEQQVIIDQDEHKRLECDLFFK